MLNFSSLGAGASAQKQAEYYSNLGHEDYYSTGGEPVGRWIGRGAEKFGFGGQTVQKTDLHFAFQGYNPKYGDVIAKNAGEQHKAGYDMTFAAPKSVSILWATSDELMRRAISFAMEMAVEKAIAYAEQSGAFVQREGHAGVSKIPYLDGLTVACFEHSSSRNLDPHLHRHAVVCNLSPNGKRIDFDASRAREIGAVFRTEFAQELKKLNLSIERDRFSFCLSAVPIALEKELSSRRAEIEKMLDEKGLSGGRAAQMAVFATRQTKQEVDRQTLFEHAREVAHRHGFNPALCHGKTSLTWNSEKFLRTTFDHASTLTETRLRTAMLESVQGVSDSKSGMEKLAEMETSGELIRLQGPGGRTRYTSREMYQLEKDLIDRAVTLSKDAWHTLSRDTLVVVCTKKSMTKEQKRALEHITSNNRLALVRGIAGAGKSYMLSGAREVWECEGVRVLGCAPSSHAAKNLQESANIPSMTIHKLLFLIEFGQLQLDGKTCIVMDEAGMAGSRIMSRLVEEVENTGAKLVLIGDATQLQPVDAGAAMRSLQTKVGCQELVEIRRQFNETDRQIVRRLADGKTQEAVTLMAERRQIHVYKDQAAIREAVANAVVADMMEGKSSLVMAGMNREVRNINTIVHAKLQENGFVSSDEKCFETFFGSRHFASGDRILFRENDYKHDLMNGQRATVLSAKEGEVLLKLDGSNTIRTIFAREYDHIDYAYAITVHKSQGATVDRAHFAMDPTMVDSNLAYVAGSRHRESFALHCTQDDYASLEKLLGRNREKDTSVDYLPEVLTDAQKYVDLNQQRIAMQIEDFKLMLSLKDVMREKTRLAIEVEQRKHEKENSYSI